MDKATTKKSRKKSINKRLKAIGHLPMPDNFQESVGLLMSVGKKK